MFSSRLNIEHYLISLEEINTATEHFSQKRLIGVGGFGKVYSGELSQRWKNRTVAIKRLDRYSSQGKSEFYNELEMISGFRHKNIISLIGFCDEDHENIIVYEYAMNGSLDRHIQDPNKRCCITWIQRLKICLGAARGLSYLHLSLGKHNAVIHRDFKSANILLDESLVAKISDFGLSKLDRYDSDNYKNAVGTRYYMDPSYIESGIPSKESDVYSFGVVLFEMLSGMLVYHPRSIDNEMAQSLIHLVRRYYDKEVDKLIDPQIRDQFDRRSFDKFKEIAYQCISIKPMERPTMHMVSDRIEEALDIELQKNDAALIECVMEDIGFSHGIPILAFTIYNQLLKQKYLTAERTTAFDRILKIFSSAIEDRDNDNQMAYWLSNASTLLFLVHKGLMIAQVEAKNPALRFEQQLTEYVEKVYGILCDNLKIKLGPLLSLCINQAPPKSKGLSISKISVGQDSQFNYWQGILNSLDALLHTLEENFVPSIIIQKIFSQTFSCINVELFNSLLRGPDYCTVSNAEYMKAGLAELEHWCFPAKIVYVGSAWDKLKHIRQAIGFLALDEKCMVSYDKFANVLCPILSLQQLYKIWTLYWGDNNDGILSSNVISSLSILRSKDFDDASSNSFLLDDSSSIHFSVDDISISLQVKDFANVEPALQQLSKYGSFRFLYN